MMWLTWRQHRAGLAAGAGTLAALAVFVAVTGNRMRTQFTSLGLDRCATPLTDTCRDATVRFQQANSGLLLAVVLLLVAPALVGLFWGAPLVARELEQGTHRLVWTQSVTRLRWLAVKVGVLASATAVLLGSATALLAWWLDPVLRVRPQRLSSPVFDLLGVMPAAYAVAALAIGIAAGTLVRRTLPALGLTLLVFFALRVGVELGVRPHYQEPVTVEAPWVMGTGDKGPDSDGEEGWVLSRENVTADGRFVGSDGGIDVEPVWQLCPEVPRPDRPSGPGSGGELVPVGPLSPALQSCATRLGFHVVTVYHPEDRFWRFQLTEAAIYGAVSVAALGLSARWIRRRLA